MTYKSKKSSGVLKTPDIHGIYQSMRAIEKGFLNFNSYTGNMFNISKTKNKGQYKMSIGKGKLTQITYNLYLFDNENGMQAA